MKKSLAPLFLIALGVAAISTGVFYTLVASRYANGASANAERKVVVAVRDLSRGHKISAGDVREDFWAGGKAPEGSYKTRRSVEGLVATRAIRAHEPVVEQTATSPETGGGLGVPSGMRAISARITDSSGVLAMLKPGHRVDVQAVHVRSAGEGDVRTVLENIEVLRVNLKDTGSKGEAQQSVTFLVSPKDADTLALADSLAKVRLTLRNPLDDQISGRAAAVPVRQERRRTSAATASVASRPALSFAGDAANSSCNTPSKTVGQ